MQLTFGLRWWMTDFIDCIIASWGLSVSGSVDNRR